MKCLKCHKILQWFGFAIIGGNLALIGLVIFWLLQSPTVPNVIVPINILNDNNEIAIGEQIELEIFVDKPFNPDQLVDSSVSITCNDGNLITLTSVTRNLPSGASRIVNDDYLLPPKALPNTHCKFNFRNVYRVNPLKNVTQHWASEEFKVL